MNNVLKVDLIDMQKDNMIQYYDEILKHRGIPDTRDGLMEVQRRILWTCYDKNWISSKPHTKFAKINGMVLGLHPHGTASVYDAAINMGQEWKNQIELIDVYGNGGSIFGDPAGADRYVEGRTHKNAEELLLSDVNSDCLDFIPNYDNTEVEPKVLSSKLPLYLINGAFGISGGYSVSVPTHNPIEVIDETISFIKNPNHQVTLLPDFPTGGFIIDSKDLHDGYNKGRGKVVIRSKIEKDEKKHRLIIREIPYQKTLDKIKNDIIDCANEHKDKNKKIIPPKIPGIKNVKDGSKKGNINLIVEVKRDYPLEQVESMLYKYTPCQDTMSIILLGVVDNEFKIYTHVNQIVEEWLNHRRHTIQRVKLGLIKKYKKRLHIIDGLLKVLDPKVIDTVVAGIKVCNSRKEVIDMLINNFDLSNIQAENIAELKLYRLSAMQVSELEAEKTNLLSKVEDETSFFKNKTLIDGIIIKELTEYRSKYKQPRKTVLLKSEDIDTDNDYVPDTEHSLIITKGGYIKKLAPIPVQKRNGKGYNVGKMKDGDYPVYMTNANNKDSMLIFTSVGKAYKFNIKDFNDGTTSTLGTMISPAINSEVITSCVVIPHNAKNDDYSILIATRKNKIKLTELSEFNNINSSGIIASKLGDGDEILNVLLIDNSKETQLLISATNGNSVLTTTSEIPVIGRTTFGTSAMYTKLTDDGHELVSVDFRKPSDTHILTVASNGLGKIVNIGEYGNPVKRGTKGVISTKLKDGSKLFAAKFCNAEEQLSIITNENIISMNIDGISEFKRTTYGVKLKDMTSTEVIMDITIP